MEMTGNFIQQIFFENLEKNQFAKMEMAQKTIYESSVKNLFKQKWEF